MKTLTGNPKCMNCGSRHSFFINFDYIVGRFSTSKTSYTTKYICSNCGSTNVKYPYKIEVNKNIKIL